MMDVRVVGSVIVGACMIGFLFDGFLRVGPWGPGFGLLVTVAVVLVLSVAMEAGHSIGLGTITLGAGAVLCSWMLALRDAPTLVGFDLLFCAGMLVAIPGTAVGSRLIRMGPAEGCLTTALSLADTLFGSLLFVSRDVPWTRLREARLGKPTLAIARGTLLAALPFVVFASLLSAADAVFSKLLADVIAIDLESLVLHALFFTIGTWLGLGFLARAGGKRNLPDISLDLKSSPRLGFIEVIIVLGTIDVLFLAFVAIQFRYFFGGAETIRLLPGLTRAEYARQGFFELVSVATLVLLLLLFVDWISDCSSRTQMWMRGLAAFQIVMVGVMLLSAWVRMRLYVDEFGLTELRLYTTAFMVWLGVVLVWFCATVLPGTRYRFATGAVVLAVMALASLNMANPDAIIVRTNVARAVAGRTLDVSYLAGLSDDAVVEIERSIEIVEPDRAKELVSLLEAKAVSDVDWRSWNLSRSRARAVVERVRSAGASEPTGPLRPSSAPRTR